MTPRRPDASAPPGIDDVLDELGYAIVAQPRRFARNLLLRSARRRRLADALVDRLAGELRAAGPATPADDRAHRLRSALAELSERDREIVTLTAWEDLAPREIATVMATSPNAVRIRLHRARKQLESRLATPEEIDAVWRSHAPVIDS